MSDFFGRTCFYSMFVSSILGLFWVIVFSFLKIIFIITLCYTVRIILSGFGLWCLDQTKSLWGNNHWVQFSSCWSGEVSAILFKIQVLLVIFWRDLLLEIEACCVNVAKVI